MDDHDCLDSPPEEEQVIQKIHSNNEHFPYYPLVEYHVVDRSTARRLGAKTAFHDPELKRRLTNLLYSIQHEHTGYAVFMGGKRYDYPRHDDKYYVITYYPDKHSTGAYEIRVERTRKDNTVIETIDGVCDYLSNNWHERFGEYLTNRIHVSTTAKHTGNNQ